MDDFNFFFQVSEAGVHRPHVAGIHGREDDGAYSIVLSGGYEDDNVRKSKYFEILYFRLNLKKKNIESGHFFALYICHLIMTFLRDSKLLGSSPSQSKIKEHRISTEHTKKQ